jgi:hypothetical protein
MADIAAANIGAWEWVGSGNKYLVVSKVKGDGTGVTVPTPLHCINAAWTQAIDDIDGSTKLSAVTGISISSSAHDGIITYASAPTSDKYHWLFVLGTT